MDRDAMPAGLAWLKDIEFKDLLTGDTLLVYETCGTDVLIALLENLPSINIFVSTKPITKARKRYIKHFYDGKNAKILASRLGCSERFIWDVLSKNGSIQKDG